MGTVTLRDMVRKTTTLTHINPKEPWPIMTHMW